MISNFFFLDLTINVLKSSASFNAQSVSQDRFCFQIFQPSEQYTINSPLRVPPPIRGTPFFDIVPLLSYLSARHIYWRIYGKWYWYVDIWIMEIYKITSKAYGGNCWQRVLRSHRTVFRDSGGSESGITVCSWHCPGNGVPSHDGTTHT